MKFFVRLTMIAVCACLVFQSHPGFGSGGSVISAGVFGGQGGDTGHRQLIALERKGAVLCAIPENSPVRLITIDAPGVKRGHVILRELAIAGEKTSLLVSVPADIGPHIRRAILYLSPAYGKGACYQELDTGWRRVDPIRMIAPSLFHGQGGSEALWACPVERLGHFVFSPPSPQTELGSPPTEEKAVSIPMGSVRKGVYPWICAGLFFITIGVLSYMIHHMECKESR